MWLIEAIISLFKGLFLLIVNLVMGLVCGIPFIGLVGLILLACKALTPGWIAADVIVGTILGWIFYVNHS